MTSLAMRAAVAFFGVFGYELDPRTLSEADRVEIREQVAYYLARRELFQRGRFIRLRSPFGGDGNETAWAVVSDDRRRAVVGHYRVLSRPVRKRDRLVVRGLDAAATYRVSVWPSGGDVAIERSGAELMAVGLPIEPSDPFPARPNQDFTARLFDLDATP